MATQFSLTRLAAAWGLCGTLVGTVTAQTATVTITGRGLGSPPSVAGFGNTPLSRLPLQASIYGSARLADAGVQSIGGLTVLDASVGDAYNADGYWSIVSVRGYTLDNRYNYRRDGLPISAETAIALDNKERVEVLKGISGMQAGTSAPGGLVNLVTKRANGTVRNASLEARQSGSLLATVDLGDRLTADGRFGLRLNAAAERLDPRVRHTKGDRWLVALAGDAQLTPDTLLQAELEGSHQRQPSVAGFSMLGDVVPGANTIDTRLNLNDQPWRQPVVLQGRTASLRIQQRINDDWSLSAHAMQQRLKSDDGTAFPYGVYDPVTYDCPEWCDRFAPDGTFTYWEYVSHNERRNSRALQLAAQGKARTGSVLHQMEFGVLATRYEGRFEDQVFDIAGTGRIDGRLSTGRSFGGVDANTNRDERSTELFARDAMKLAPGWLLWGGVRHTRLQRESVRTNPASDGLRDTRYDQSFSAPWLGLSHELTAATIVYASWGQGLESEVAPNRARYINRGLPLAALKSRQFEAGVKHDGEDFEAGLAYFDIDRPQAVDAGDCGAANTCTRLIDGSAWHRGLEGQATLRQAQWTWQASAMWLKAERRNATVQVSGNGRRPVNAPHTTLRLGADYRVSALPGLALQARAAVESNRVVLPYGPEVRISGWSRIDLGARWRHGVGTQARLWRVGVNNVTDRRAWKESPYQFGHVYLYPLPVRTWRASVQWEF